MIIRTHIETVLLLSTCYFAIILLLAIFPQKRFWKRLVHIRMQNIFSLEVKNTLVVLSHSLGSHVPIKYAHEDSSLHRMLVRLLQS